MLQTLHCSMFKLIMWHHYKSCCLCLAFYPFIAALSKISRHHSLTYNKTWESGGLNWSLGVAWQWQKFQSWAVWDAAVGSGVIKEAICTIEFPPNSHSHDHEAFSKETQALKMGIVKVLLIKIHLKKIKIYLTIEIKHAPHSDWSSYSINISKADPSTPLDVQKFILWRHCGLS